MYSAMQKMLRRVGGRDSDLGSDFCWQLATFDNPKGTKVLFPSVSWTYIIVPGDGSALGGRVNLLAAVRPSTNELGGLW